MNVNGEGVDYKQCKIEWYTEASMKDNRLPSVGGGWVGDPLPGSTVASCIREFRNLLPEVQRRVVMFVEAGVVGGSKRTMLGYDELVVIAARNDVPE